MLARLPASRFIQQLWHGLVATAQFGSARMCCIVNSSRWIMQETSTSGELGKALHAKEHGEINTPLDVTSVIHAYDAGPVTPGTACAHHDDDSQAGSDQWHRRSSSLLCCFSSSDYVPQRDTPATAQLAPGWQDSSGELKIFSQGRGAKSALLGPQRPEHVGRITLVLDLDGVIYVADRTQTSQHDAVRKATMDGGHLSRSAAWVRRATTSAGSSSL